MLAERTNALHQRLDFALQSLDIPRELQERATAVYDALGKFVHAYDAAAGRREPEFYPQGSAALGTATMDDDWDIDAVYQRQLARASITQEVLKSQAGEMLLAFQADQRRRGQPVPRIVERNRCWRLVYPGFHVDALPAIPEDLDDESSTRLLIADRDPEVRLWIVTDPKGYIAWFIARMGDVFERERRMLAEASARAMEQVPVWEVKTVLQRAVQFMRRHRDESYGEQDRDLRPCSMLITTVAGRAYRGEGTIPEALRTIASAFSDPSIVEMRDGELWVPNPTNEDENLARAFVGDSRRLARFQLWVRRFQGHVNGIEVARGVQLDRVLAEAIGERPAMAAAQRAATALTESRDAGALRMAGGTGMLGTVGAVAVPRHTFHGRAAK
jgi:hypothetical protein